MNDHKKKTILITGSSGMIGTALGERFLSLGHEVIGIDTQRNQWNHKLDGLTLLVDLKNPNQMTDLPKKIDIVIHLAAHARVYESVENPEFANENWLTTFNILEYCRRCHIPRFVLASSREVYGNSVSGQPRSETEAYTLTCESPYSASKIGCEALVHAYKQCYDLPFVIVRYSNVYGRYDMSSRVIPRFITRILQNKNLVVYGKSKQLDFTYLDDAVKGTVSMVNRFDQIKNQVFNIASGQATTIETIAQLIERELGQRTIQSYQSVRPGEIQHFLANISKAKKQLGYEPKIGIIEGIQKTVQWYKEYYKARLS